MNCSKCGNPISPNIKFCAKCGTPVPQQSPVQQNVPTAQPVQQNVAIQPQKPPKKKKSSKNLPLIIVAVVLVLAVLASTIAIVPGIIRNKNEINAATEYIDDFPILKQQTELLVFDAEKFPSEKYEIKVERMLMGGVFNGIFKSETIIDEISTEHVYNIDFKEDGDYRITLTDITAERTQVTSEQSEITEATSGDKTEVVEIIIIIDVKVDDDNEDAVDSVELDASTSGAVADPSDQEKEAEFLEATDADFRELEKLLESVSMPHEYAGEGFNEFDYEAENALYEASSQIMGPFNWLYGYYDDYFGWNSDWKTVSPEYTGEEVYSKSYDPLNKYTYDYMYFPAAKVDWLLENAFNVKPQHTEIYGETSEEKWLDSYYYEGYYYVDTGDAGWISPNYRIENFEKMSDGTYKMLILSGYEGNFEDSVDFYEIVAGVKEHEGKRYWSFYSIKIHKDIPADALELNGHYYKIFTDTCNSWDDARTYCESIGGHLAVISSEEENEALFNYMRGLELKTAYFGYSDAGFEGEWKWVNGETGTYTNWHSGEPNGRNSENYAEFYYQFNDGTWNDGDFGGGVTTRDETAFICEWE